MLKFSNTQKFIHKTAAKILKPYSKGIEYRWGMNTILINPMVKKGMTDTQIKDALRYQKIQRGQIKEVRFFRTGRSML